MFGAIAGDIIGSLYEGANPRNKHSFPLFQEGCRVTDDSVLSLAIAETARLNLDYGLCLKDWGRRYPNAGYGQRFYDWLENPESEPYNSFGNGSAMRVSSIAWIFKDCETVRKEAVKSAGVTHNHPEGMKGAEAIATAIFYAKNGASKDDIRNLMEEEFGYRIHTVSHWSNKNHFDVTCQGTVPAAIAAFVESESIEDTIRNAVSMGGDTDTLAAVAGSIAEAFYQGISSSLFKQIWPYLDWHQQGEACAFLHAYYPYADALRSALTADHGKTLTAEEVRFALMRHSDPVEAAHKQRFFKTKPGEYGDGDRFLGIKVPHQRKVAKQFVQLPLEEVDRLLKSRLHEERLTALLILTYRYKRSDDAEQTAICNYYLSNRAYINNWDLVDVTAPHIVGSTLKKGNRTIIYELAASDVLWDRRIAMLSTLAWIRENDFDDTLKLAKQLLNDPHDLMHKAVGWMLRELGKRNAEVLDSFLIRHHATMPRTMLRYAIEKMPEAKRRDWLKGKV